MRGCCLIIVMIGLILATLMILFANIFGLSFNWNDWLIYLAVALVAYFIILIIGKSLNKQFSSLIDDFIIGEKEKLIEKAPFKVFGFLLFVLLPYLIYLNLFGFYSAVTLGVYGFWLMSGASRIPVVIPLALIIIVFGTAIAEIIGFFYLIFPPRTKPFGIELKKSDEPILWKEACDVARSVGSKPVDRIIATPFPCIGVYLNGNFFATLFGGGERILEIGFPSIYNLKIGEFKAILAHEYGHFSNKDTQWGSFTYSMGNSLTSTLRAMPGPSEGSDGTLAALLSYNPAYWILYYFLKLFFAVTNGFSRAREVLADKKSCELYGGNFFSNGLQKVSLNDTIFYRIVESQYVPELLKSKQVFTSFSKAMELAYDKRNKAEIEEIQKDILNFIGDENLSTHPKLKVRIEYAKRFENKSDKKDSRLINELFADWQLRNEEAINLYNYIMMARKGLLNTDGTIKEQIETQEESASEVS